MLASTGAASADMVIPAVAAPDCVNIEKAFIQQGITDPKKIVAAAAVPQRPGRGGPRR